MAPIDHLFVIAFVIVYPVAGFISFRRLIARVAAGQRPDRIALYRHTIIGHWLLFIVALLVWNQAGRPWAILGVSLDLTWHFFVAAILTLTGIGALIWQLTRVVRGGQDMVDRLGGDLGKLSVLIPHCRAELRMFSAVSLTAGIVEEVLWRGFLMWYLANFFPLWAVVVLSSLGFGIAHAYQGMQHVPKIALVGALFATLYVISGSIWLPVVMHSAIDLLQGRLAFEIVSRNKGEVSQPANS